MTVRVAKVEACDGSVRDVVIRCVLCHAVVGVTNLVSAIAAEIQAASVRVELHAHNVPGACSSAYVCIQALADTNPASALQQWHLSPSQLSIVSESRSQLNSDAMLLRVDAVDMHTAVGSCHWDL